MKDFLTRRWFMLALAGVLGVSFAFSPGLAPLVDQLPRSAIVFGVIFCTALPLDASSMWRALKRPGATLLGVSVNFGLLPLWAWLLTWVAGCYLHDDLRHGLLIAAAAPCTIASAVVWTRRAGGNDAVAILVTMVTNVTCFFFTPTWLRVTAGATISPSQVEELDPQRMMLRLLLLVGVPVVAGQLLRRYRPLGRWSTTHKTGLGVLAQLGVLSMVLTGSVRAGVEMRYLGDESTGPAASGQMVPSGSLGASPTSDAAPAGANAHPLQAVALQNSQPKTPARAASPTLGDWGLMFCGALAIHLGMLLAAVWGGRLLGLPRPDRIAAGFSGSQKTLLVGLDIASEYVEVFGPLALLPMVAYHVLQLLVDTVIADRMAREA